jgi:hypothetical protein
VIAPGALLDDRGFREVSPIVKAKQVEIVAEDRSGKVPATLPE